MRLTRLFLRNYRVYEEPIELHLPAGLVGIYGPNGAGKSYLIESVRWTLFGQSRTSKDEVRTDGVNADCVTEVELEHEGHLYQVRRTISGVNNTVKAEALADGRQVAEGVRDVTSYVQSVLGMDDHAFRSSVFAEQKQVAAFSHTNPAKRKELVLRLLGIIPLDTARDQARSDARAARDDHERNRSRLPELDEIAERVAAASAAVEAAEETAATAGAAAAAARRLADATEQEVRRLDDLHRTFAELKGEGTAARQALDGAKAQVSELEADLAELADADETLTSLRADAAGVDALDERIPLVRAALDAAGLLAALPPEPAAERPDRAPVEAARAAAQAAGERASQLGGQVEGARAAVARAREAAERSAGLSPDEDCPVCGQALGDALEQVQQHRDAELAAAEQDLAELESRMATAAAEADTARRTLTALEQAFLQSEKQWQQAEEVRGRRRDATDRLAEAERAAGGPVTADDLRELQAELRRRREAASQVERLEAKLERRPALEAKLASAKERAEQALGQRNALLEKVKALGYDERAHAEARTALEQARTSADAAATRLSQAQLAVVTAQGVRDRAADELERGRQAHHDIADLAERARHLSRVAELLAAFRDNVIATVGPRLAEHAADLFAELTDHEYDRLEVDPETYDIQIRDAGTVYGMDRFSGSETDLANLALRVAISEHVRFQSGGAVGLLVLDEVFGPLDADRKERMLGALQRLHGRFRQVLVVTHDSDMKEQLPGAIEVVKLPGRRATARVLAGV